MISREVIVNFSLLLSGQHGLKDVVRIFTLISFFKNPDLDPDPDPSIKKQKI